MSLQKVIADHFKIEITRDGWISIPCILHNDGSNSAGIQFDNKDGGVFNCFVCGAKPLKFIADELKLEYDLNNLNFLDEYDEAIFTPVKIKQIKQVEEYTKFLDEKKLLVETIESVGGYYCNDINDSRQLYGHLVFPYGKDNKLYCARRILEQVSNQRFQLAKGSSKGLYGEQNVKGNDPIILVEGITDYLTLLQVGYTNLVSTFGAKVSKEQMYRLRGKTVFILFDVDYAGHSCGLETATCLREYKATPIILEIPSTFATTSEDKIDVNSAWCKDPVVFESWLAEELNKYNSFDSSYADSLFSGKRKSTPYWFSSIPEFNRATSGGYAPGVHVIAGTPGVGKSSLVIQDIDCFVKQGAKVLLCSYELTKVQYWARLASRYSEHNWNSIEKDPTILEPHVKMMMIQLGKRLKIVADWQIEQIKHASKTFDVICVDYVQRMTAQDKEEREAIKFNVNELSNLVRYQDKIVLMVSSISRASYNEPSMSSFKETGSIEFVSQTARILTGTKDHVMMHLLKNTRGESGKVLHTQVDFEHQRMVERELTEIFDVKGNSNNSLEFE